MPKCAAPIPLPLPKLSSPGVAPKKMRVMRVAIDPGHGGVETGTQSREGVLEKDVALNLSLNLAKRLKQQGYAVLLTRQSDKHLELEERALLANRFNADIFISIHVNFAPQKTVQGIETYYLDAPTDAHAMRMALRENKNSTVELILADLKHKAETLKSFRLAQSLQERLYKQAQVYQPEVKNHGVKSALFSVLLGVKMPGALVETAFLSNEKEAQLLMTSRYQNSLAEGISDGIHDYFEKIKIK